MESKKGAFIVLGLLLVLAVVLLIFCAKRGGEKDSNFDATLASWKSGLLAKLAKSQQLAASELDANPFNAKGEATLSGAASLTCNVAKSRRSVRSATLELAGPGTVTVKLVAVRKGGDIESKKKLQRSTASGEADDKAKFALMVFEDGGTLTIESAGGPAGAVKLRWKDE